MSGINRRSFLGLGAAIPLSAWLEQTASAQGFKKFVRYDARSPKGKKMLESYAKAVAKMKNTDPGNPLSWTFQWYTHWIKGPQRPYAAVVKAKNDEINRIYPTPGPNAHRELARTMWDNCEAHGNGVLPPGGTPEFPPQNENYFLPWHRMYVYFFERIIRTVSEDPEFSLPYWNYSTLDMKIRGIIPEEFIKRNDPTFSSLYVENRNPWINQGKPIAGDITPGNPNDPLTLDSLAQVSYEPTSSTVRGFNETLDFGLHGNIHVGVGNSTNMGSVPTAAEDPIFWLHHCNIDRLWASWNNAGRINPYLNQEFTFADEKGRRVVGNISDFLNIANHNYTYEHLEPVPGAAPHLALEAARRQAPRIRAAGRRISLGDKATSVNLEAKAEGPNEQPAALGAHLERMGDDGRVYLVVKGLETDAAPGVLYNLYLDLPANANEEQKRAHAVGVINFFHAHGPAAAAGHEVANADQGHAGGVSVSFDITNVARGLQKTKELNATAPVLTVVPVGSPDAAAKPVIGEVSIIQI